MFGTYFYHQKMRKCVSTFGSLFNNLYVIRQDASGQVINTQKVPLAYASREKFLERIRTHANLDDENIAIKLPRMSFEMTSIMYDSTRQLNKMHRQLKTGDGPTKRGKINSPVPYIMMFTLNIYTNTQDDALQIVEQIVPFFSPQYTVTMKPFAEYSDVKEDIPVTLMGVNFTDDVEGSMESRRTIMYTLDFELKMQFNGPISTNNSIITKTITEFELDKIGTTTFRQIITPNPAAILYDSDYGFVRNDYDFTVKITDDIS